MSPSTKDQREWPPGTFLGGLSAYDLDALLRRGHRRHWSQGDVLFRQGDLSRHVLLILDGSVKTTVATPDGAQALLNIKGHGELVGGTGVLTSGARATTVTALTACDTLVVSGEVFRSFLEGHPAAALVLLGVVAEDLRHADRERVSMVSDTTAQRVARVLVELSEKYGTPIADGILISLALSQTDLAGIVGSSREAVARILRRLRDDNVVATRYRQVVVQEPETLLRLAGPAYGEGTANRQGEEWQVRAVAGGASGKRYRCPGCDQVIEPGVSHLVAWQERDGVADRRHWHHACWHAKDRRSAETRRRSGAPPP